MIIDRINWKVGITKDNIEIKWIPICTVEFGSENKRIIGLSQDSLWINTFELPRKNDLYIIKSREDSYHIMAILDNERAEIEELIKKGIEYNDLALEIFNTFPFKENFWSKPAR